VRAQQAAGPVVHSKTARKASAREVVQSLQQYAACADDYPSGQQVERLLRISARLDVMLFLETGGRLGDANSHAQKVADRWQAK
jgi:hypothetical protein